MIFISNEHLGVKAAKSLIDSQNSRKYFYLDENIEFYLVRLVFADSLKRPFVVAPAHDTAVKLLDETFLSAELQGMQIIDNVS